MNLRKILDTALQILTLDIDNNITFAEENIFIRDENNDITINYIGTLDDNYIVNIDGEITSI